MYWNCMKSILKTLIVLFLLLTIPVSAFSSDNPGDRNAAPDSITKQNSCKPYNIK